MNKREVLFRTSDLYFSAYLCSLDLTMIATETEKGGDGKKVVFVFKVPEEDMARLKSSYFGGSGEVKARKFVDNLRNLKSLTHI